MERPQPIDLPRFEPHPFVRLEERLPASLDRSLGYPGHRRFVIFYYEPRGEEVVWSDDRSYGFGTGGWCAFEARVAPLARRYGADLGSDRGAGRDALVLDRATGSAYFARRDDAERFVAAGGRAGAGAVADAVAGTASTAVTADGLERSCNVHSPGC